MAAFYPIVLSVLCLSLNGEEEGHYMSRDEASSKGSVSDRRGNATGAAEMKRS